MLNNEEYTKLKQSFDIYYNNNILPILKDIEKTRKVYLAIFIPIAFLSIIWAAYMVFTLYNKESSQLQNILSDYGAINCFVIILLLFPMFFYKRKSKQSLLPLISRFFGEFSYSNNQQLSTSIIENSMIIPKHDILCVDDNFYGMYKDVPVNIMEYAIMDIHYEKTNTQYKEKNIKKGQGVVFYAKMNKNFKGKTIIIKDKGIFNVLTRFNNLKRVGIESVEFEKIYEIYSDNQVEARYILTTSMMKHMLELKNKFSKIEYSFFDEYVFINIKTKKNLFECSSFFRSIINQKRIDKTFQELYLLFSIIDTLKLNEKIYPNS